MAFDSHSISLAIAIVALGMTIYLYRKTSIEIHSIKTRTPSIVQMQPLPNPLPGKNLDENPQEEKSTEEVKDEA